MQKCVIGELEARFQFKLPVKLILRLNILYNVCCVMIMGKGEPNFKNNNNNNNMLEIVILKS